MCAGSRRPLRTSGQVLAWRRTIALALAGSTGTRGPRGRSHSISTTGAQGARSAHSQKLLAPFPWLSAAAARRAANLGAAGQVFTSLSVAMARAKLECYEEMRRLIGCRRRLLLLVRSAPSPPCCCCPCSSACCCCCCCCPCPLACCCTACAVHRGPYGTYLGRTGSPAEPTSLR